MGNDQSRAEQRQRAQLHLQQYQRQQALHRPSAPLATAPPMMVPQMTAPVMPVLPARGGAQGVAHGFHWVEGAHDDQETHDARSQAAQGGQSDQGPKQEQPAPAEWRMDDGEDVLELVARHPLVDISIMSRSVEDLQVRLFRKMEVPELPLPVDTTSDLRVYLAGWQKLKGCWPCESYAWGSNYQQQELVWTSS